MQGFWLAPNSYTVIRFRVHRPRQSVSIRVGADRAVRVFVVDQRGLQDFQAGQRFYAYAGHGRTVNFEASVVLQRGEYILLLSNPNQQRVFIYYEMQ